MLLFYGVEKKKHSKNVAEMRAKYNKLKEKNAAPKKYKKWTCADEAEITKLMSDDATLDDAWFGKQIAQLKE